MHFLNSAKSDASLFLLHRSSIHIFALVYVNNIVIMGSDASLVWTIIRELSASFVVKDLGAFCFFLGLEVLSCKDGLLLSQHKYIRDILERHSMDGAKPFTTPMASSLHV